VPEGSPYHHAPTQIQTLAHRRAAAGGRQINGTINVRNPDTVVLGPGIATLVSNGGKTILSDVFARIGGASVGKATQTLVVNSSNVIGDDLWLGRADHGNGGADYFYQSEMPYGPPNQPSWMDGSAADLTSFN
jgi:hypothetical protein